MDPHLLRAYVRYEDYYNKSEIIPMNMEDQELENFRRLFGCPVGAFPIKYLGIPLHYEKLRREDLQPLVDKIVKRIAGWRGEAPILCWETGLRGCLNTRY